MYTYALLQIEFKWHTSTERNLIRSLKFKIDEYFFFLIIFYVDCKTLIMGCSLTLSPNDGKYTYTRKKEYAHTTLCKDVK